MRPTLAPGDGDQSMEWLFSCYKYQPPPVYRCCSLQYSIIYPDIPMLAMPSTATPPAPMAADKAISIRAFKPEDLASVIGLFSAGQLYYAEKAEHAAIRKIFTDYVPQSINDDLAKVDEVYFKSGGHFWVATADEDGKEIVVGCVGLEGKPEKEGELRRMSVSADYRRYGVGRLLVSTLENWAKTNGFRKVWLSTGSPMVQAVKFYLSINYTQIKVEVILEEPRFEVVFFEKEEECAMTPALKLYDRLGYTRIHHENDP